ncbi:MAG TPA: uroporphyrinogen-III synthase [Bacteroidales bacterium]
MKNRIFISTVNANKSAEVKRVFEPHGATIIDFPMIEIIAADLSSVRGVISRNEDFEWVIFTSTNGASYFYTFLQEISGHRNLSKNTRIAVIGQSTAKVVKKLNRTPDFIGTGNTAEDLADELIEKDLITGLNILLPLGNLAPDTVQNRLSKVASVTRINVYKTVRAKYIDHSKIDLIKDDRYDLILFTSPSGVENFVVTMGKENIHPNLRVASIGKVTAQAVEKQGLKSLITSEVSTYEGLMEEIVKYYESNDHRPSSVARS